MQWAYIPVGIVAIWCVLIPLSFTLVPLLPLATVTQKDSNLNAWFMSFETLVNGTVQQSPWSAGGFASDCATSVQWMYPVFVLTLVGSYAFCVQLIIVACVVSQRKMLPAAFVVSIDVILLGALVAAWQVLSQWNNTCFLD